MTLFELKVTHFALVEAGALDRARGRAAAHRQRRPATARGRMAEFADVFDWEPPTAGSIAFPALKTIERFTATQFCDAVVEHCGVMLLPSSVYGIPAEKDANFRLGFGRTGVPKAVAVLREHLRGIVKSLSQ